MSRPAFERSVPPLRSPRVEAAVSAVRAAIAACRAVQRARASVPTLTKDDRSPVTVADYASQAVVAHTLSARFGPVGLVAEEDAALLCAHGEEAHLEAAVQAARVAWPDVTPASFLEALGTCGAAPDAGGFWTLDPVDGTKGFLRGQQYAVSLAFVCDGAPVLGVLGCPNLGTDPGGDPEQAHADGILCVAAAGAGAYQLPVAPDRGLDTGRRLHASPAASGEAVSLCTSFEGSHSDTTSIASIRVALGRPTRMLRLDSQCKYALTARGQAHAYVRVAGSAGYVEWIWDHAAGALVAAEAGCRVSDLFGRPLDFGRGRRLEANRGILCAPPDLHADLVAAVRAAALADPLPSAGGRS